MSDETSVPPNIENEKVVKKGLTAFAKAMPPAIEIAAWHAIHIHHHLNGFYGYDSIKIELKRATR